MSEDKRESNMKAIAAMLACPHQWGEVRQVRLVDKGKPKDGDLVTCRLCGTHRVKYPDGRGAMFSPDALSTEPPKG